MNSALGPRIVSLWDMLEVNGALFVQANAELVRVKTIIDHSFEAEGQSAVVEPGIRTRFSGDLDALMGHLLGIGARVAWIAANQLHQALTDPEVPVTYGQMSAAIEVISGRLRDELTLVKLFVVSGDQANLFGGADYLLGQPTAERFKDVWFDCQEAAKCLVLGRPTACVFHTMRMLEIGIKALAKRLCIEDPLRPSKRNWGAILGTIKGEIDAKFPISERLPHTEGAFLESVYVSLDAIKNPWRNATMHVEATYTESEAFQILNCSVSLIQKMAGGFDQDGSDVNADSLLLEGQEARA